MPIFDEEIRREVWRRSGRDGCGCGPCSRVHRRVHGFRYIGSQHTLGSQDELDSPSGSAVGVGFAASAVLVAPFVVVPVVPVVLGPEVDLTRALVLLKNDLTLSIFDVLRGFK